MVLVVHQILRSKKAAQRSTPIHPRSRVCRPIFLHETILSPTRHSQDASGPKTSRHNRRIISRSNRMALFSHILDYKSLTGFDLRDLSRKTRAARGFGRTAGAGRDAVLVPDRVASGRQPPEATRVQIMRCWLPGRRCSPRPMLPIPNDSSAQPPRPLALPSEVWINPPADGPEPRMLQLPRDTNFVPQLSQTH